MSAQEPVSSTTPSSATNITTSTAAASQDASGRQPSSSSSRSAELAGAKISLRQTLRSFPDFPIPGHRVFQAKPDVIVGLDARGFLFGPGLALRLGVPFAAVRKKGKLPGPCVTAEYGKEYGTDFFQMQEDAVREGQKVLVVDDIIATGGSAKAAADLVHQLKGEVVGYLFILQIPGLNGRDKLGNIPTQILLEDA
ncbi:hypothetical protein MRS44_001579 [Fusarium solani]|uniref:uncharacterized protein n=1 Tax=Fusarium solani TaxID=169388 RepID=UPI0032C4A8E2|nr:hypothetical protein MRS44_001579 [Fusarium solani]